MRLRGLLLLLAALTVGGAFLSPSPAPTPPPPMRDVLNPAGAPPPRMREGGCKPTAPIDVEARLVGDPAAGFSVEASAKSRTGAEVELEVVLPDGVAHVAGPRKLKGKKPETRVDARVKKGGRQEILVRATFVEGGATMTRVVSLVVNDAPVARPGMPAKSGGGAAVLEFSP